jgi:hypothetical protein
VFDITTLSEKSSSLHRYKVNIGTEYITKITLQNNNAYYLLAADDFGQSRVTITKIKKE